MKAEHITGLCPSSPTPYDGPMRRLVSRLALLGAVSFGLLGASGCYYRYPYKVKKKPSSCPYKRPAKKAER